MCVGIERPAGCGDDRLQFPNCKETEAEVGATSWGRGESFRPLEDVDFAIRAAFHDGAVKAEEFAVPPHARLPLCFKISEPVLPEDGADVARRRAVERVCAE